MGQTATQQEVGKAYKRKCLEWHPDKHGQDEESQNKAREMFNAIGEANELLTDPKKRALYDEGCDKVSVAPASAPPHAMTERKLSYLPRCGIVCTHRT